MASLLVRAGAQRWLLARSSSARLRSVISGLRLRYPDRNRFALVVTAENAGRRSRMSLSGHCQAEVTSAAAAELARALVEGEIKKPGVWLPEEVVPARAFFDALRSVGYEPEIEA